MNADFAKALANLQAECKPILKDTQGYGYKYADLPAVMAMVQPLFNAHGFVFLCQPLGDNSEMYLQATLVHVESGEELTARMPLNAGAKPQELGSEITYWRRYMLSCMLNVVSDGDDDAAKAQDAHTKPDKKSTDPDWKGQQKKTALQKSARELVSALATVTCLDDITVLTDSYAQVIEDVKHNLPSWWEGQHRDGNFILGLAQHIDNAYARVADIEQGAGAVQ